MVRKVMRLPAVIAATGWAKPTLYAKITAGKFPRGTKLDPDARAVVWFAFIEKARHHSGPIRNLSLQDNSDPTETALNLQVLRLIGCAISPATAEMLAPLVFGGAS